MADLGAQNFKFAMWVFGRTIVLALVVLLLRAQTVLAILVPPGPPPVPGPPPPQCISTAPLLLEAFNSFVCHVRNAGGQAHNIKS
jgi:hypothetical protein